MKVAGALTIKDILRARKILERNSVDPMNLSCSICGFKGSIRSVVIMAGANRCRACFVKWHRGMRRRFVRLMFYMDVYKALNGGRIKRSDECEPSIHAWAHAWSRTLTVLEILEVRRGGRRRNGM